MVIYQNYRARDALLGANVLSIALIFGCGGPASVAKTVDPVYDKATGRLQLLKYDANGNGRPDTFSYMEGARVLRIEIDKDEDGKIDRWEYYGADAKLERVGFSAKNDGHEDGWSFAGPDGAVSRVELSTRRDGTVTRTEFYDKAAIARAEEDTDFDGAVDKWETYAAGGRMASVAFDTVHRGTPDRRLLYDEDGSVRAEEDPDGSAQWQPVAKR